MKNKNYIYIVLKVACIIVTLLLSSRCHNTSKSYRNAHIAFTGDIMMHVAVKKCAAYNNRVDENNTSINNHGFDFLFTRIRENLQYPDIMCGNMEFPVAPPFKQKGLIFNCPPQVIPSLKYAGFNVLTLSNNHIMDQGYDGVKSTLSYLDAAKLDYIGVNTTEQASRSGIIINSRGIRIGLIAYTGVMNYGYPPKNNIFYLNNLYAKKTVLQDVQAIRAQCDFLVMQIHTGIEYTINPRYSDTVLCKKILDAGVDLIIGHHPHILQNMEQYQTADGRTATIFYSLGNFISDQSRTIPLKGQKNFLHIRDSIIVYVSLQRHARTIIPVYRIVPIHTRHNWVSKNTRGYKEIQPIALTDEITKLQNLIKTLPVGKQQKIKKQIHFFHNRIQAIEYVLFRGKIMRNVHILKPR